MISRLHGNTIRAIKQEREQGYSVEYIADRRDLSMQIVQQAIDLKDPREGKSESQKELLRKTRKMALYYMHKAMEIDWEPRRQQRIRVVASNFADVCPEWAELI